MVLMELSSAELQLHHYAATAMLVFISIKCLMDVRTAGSMQNVSYALVVRQSSSPSEVWHKFLSGLPKRDEVGEWMLHVNPVYKSQQQPGKNYFFVCVTGFIYQEKEDRGGEEIKH